MIRTRYPAQTNYSRGGCAARHRADASVKEFDSDALTGNRIGFAAWRAKVR
jgi:hypothetical protein